MTALLHVDNISKRFGGFVALDGIELEVKPGERLGLIGPNGSGKSTLVNCICGTLQNETGTVVFNGQAIDGLAAHERTHRGVARSFQLPRPFHSMTLADNLRIPLLYTVRAREGMLHAHSDLEGRCHDLLDMVGLLKKAKHMPRDLTQVEMRKLELARAVAAEPKLLIADEFNGGPVPLRNRGYPGTAGPAERARHYRHPDRAHHERGHELARSASPCSCRARKSPTVSRKTWCVILKW